MDIEKFLIDNLMLIFPLALMGAIGYYFIIRYQRVNRSKILLNMGYIIDTNPTKQAFRDIKSISPQIMTAMKMPVGTYSIGGALLLWWVATKTVGKSNITCWAFRRTSNPTGGYKSEVEEWWIGVKVVGLSDSQKKTLSIRLNNAKPLPFYMSVSKDHVQIIYKNPKIFFSAIINKLKLIEQTVKV